jgi:hypothetical protein
MHTMLNVLKIQGGSWLASDSGGSADINPSNTAAIAASPGLDSSHLDLQRVEDCISLLPQDAYGTQCAEDPRWELACLR